MQTNGDVAARAPVDEVLKVRRAPGRRLDIAFGLALPLVCLWLDPFVFRIGSGRPAVFGQFSVAMVAAMLFGIASLSAWLLVPRPPRWLAGPLAGILGGACLLATGIGVLLLPLSLTTLVTGVGLLGLVPFGTAFVFARASARASGVCLRTCSAGKRLVLEAAGLWLFVVGPCVLHVALQHATKLALSDDHDARQRGRSILVAMRPISNIHHLVVAFHHEKDGVRAKRIGELYAAMGGGDAATEAAAQYGRR